MIFTFVRRNQGIVITVVYMFIFSTIYIQHIASTDRFVGDLEGDLVAEGRIWSDVMVTDTDFIIGCYPSPSADGGLRATVSNVSRVHLFDPPYGEYVDEWIPIVNSSFDIVCRSSSIRGFFQEIRIQSTLSDLNGSFHGKVEGYWLESLTSSLDGFASIVHRAEEEYDIEVYNFDEGGAIINGKEYNHTIWVSLSEGDSATIMFNGSGNINISPRHTFHIDGTLSISNLMRTNVFPPIRYQDIVFEGDDIGLLVVQQSDFWSHWSDNYEPEIVRITLNGRSEVESRMSYLVLGLTIIMTLIVAAWILYFIKMRKINKPT